MSKLPISVCIIAKNEEEFIEGCLQKIKPFGFEIIVTDTGSSDRTKEIASAYADKVVDFDWCNDFSKARNYCAQHASNDWILALDCDEYVNELNEEVLDKLIQEYYDSRGVIRLNNVVLDDDNNKNYEVYDVTRMYNRKYYHFEQSIHEQIVPLKEYPRLAGKESFLIPMMAVHYGYALSLEKQKIKQERNLKLLYAEFDEDKPDPYICFQIGRSEYIMKNFDRAMKINELGLSLNPSINETYVQVMVITLARIYIELGKTSDAVSLMEMYLPNCETARFWLAYADVLLDDKQYLKALMTYIHTTMKKDATMLGGELLRCYKHIVNLYECMGEGDMAEPFREKVKECEENMKRIILCD